eukprot:TRINITY_DN13636_c0_g1_i1.p1 TRINITY_DN13636_c0_g1~~TRINITY_DN13636_c0_g1_i1.p1  ORF type:complete len:156 (-),score=17.52 TRINITY_DN13636_c0_g1_i1:154-621(-)
MAVKLNAEQIATVRKAFDTHDRDKSGQIEIFELGGALRAFGMNLPDSAIRTVMHSLDLDADGSISFDEYCAFVAPYVSSSYSSLDERQLVELRQAFTVYDKDGSGEIDSSELAHVLKQSGQQYSAQQIQAIIASVDTDHSGSLSFNEFVALISKK